MTALREYVAGPVLVHTMPWQTYARRRESLLNEKSRQLASASADRMSFSEMRSYKLLDTAIAGAGTGSVLNAWRRVLGSAHAISCSDRLFDAGGPPGILPGAVTAGLICTVAQFIWNELNVMRVRYVSQLTHIGHDAPPRTLSERIMDGLGTVLPVKKIPDEVYLQNLLREKEEVEKRLGVVRKELQDGGPENKS
jgi:hypothetical protein